MNSFCAGSPLSLFILCFSSALFSSPKLHLRNVYVTISEISGPISISISEISHPIHPHPSPSLTLTHSPIHPHPHLTRSPIHPHPNLTHSPIHPHPFTLTDSSSPISISEASPSPIHRFTLTSPIHPHRFTLTLTHLNRFTLTHSQGFLGLGSDFAKTKLRRCWCCL